MPTVETSEAIDHPRRRMMSAATLAAPSAGLLGLLPSRKAFSTPAASPFGNDRIRTFKVLVGERELAELRHRVRATRWPDRELVADDSQGLNLAALRSLVAYWGNGYDWRRLEARLNRLPQFLTLIDGVDIHFIHVRSPHRETDITADFLEPLIERNPLKRVGRPDEVAALAAFLASAEAGYMTGASLTMDGGYSI